MFDLSGSSELSEYSGRALVRARVVMDSAADLASVDTEQLSSEDLRDLTLRLEQLRRFVDAGEAHVLAELDQRRVTELRSGLRTSKWLADRAGVPSGVARQRLVVAKRLAALPIVDAAFSAVRICHDHARVFTEVINDRNHGAISAILDDLIDAAAGTVFTRWRDDVTALAAVLDPDGSHDPADDVARNRLSMSPSDRFMVGRFELTGDHALSVHDALHAVADELFHQHTRDHAELPELEIPSRNTLLALALEEVCRRALAGRPSVEHPAQSRSHHHPPHPRHGPRLPQRRRRRR